MQRPSFIIRIMKKITQTLLITKKNRKINLKEKTKNVNNTSIRKFFNNFYPLEQQLESKKVLKFTICHKKAYNFLSAGNP